MHGDQLRVYGCTSSRANVVLMPPLPLIMCPLVPLKRTSKKSEPGESTSNSEEMHDASQSFQCITHMHTAGGACILHVGTRDAPKAPCEGC